MGRKKRDMGPEVTDLNLAPIMNMVMILIPLLALMAVFIEAGVINISSPRNAQANQPEEEQQEEEEQIPRIVVSISNDGFRLIDQRNLPEFAQYSQPIPGCPGAGGGTEEAGAPAGGSPHNMAANMPPTICLRECAPNCMDENGEPSEHLVDQLDFAALYNRLVQIRLHSTWFAGFGQEGNDVVSLLGDPEIPYVVLVRTMDTARYFLQAPEAGLSEPTVSSDYNTYILGGQIRASQEHLQGAEFLQFGADGRERFEMFPNPVLLLPRPGAGG